MILSRIFTWDGLIVHWALFRILLNSKGPACVQAPQCAGYGGKVAAERPGALTRYTLRYCYAIC